MDPLLVKYPHDEQSFQIKTESGRLVRHYHVTSTNEWAIAKGFPRMLLCEPFLMGIWGSGTPIRFTGKTVCEVMVDEDVVEKWTKIRQR